MSDAPHRIWVSAPNEDNEVETWTDPDEGGSPYILATPAALSDHPTVKALVAAERGAASLLRGHAAAAAVLLRNFEISDSVAQFLEDAVAQFDEAAAIRSAEDAK